MPNRGMIENQPGPTALLFHKPRCPRCMAGWFRPQDEEPRPAVCTSASLLKRRCRTGLCELCSRSRWACVVPRALHFARSSDSSVRADMDLIPTGMVAFCVSLKHCSLAFTAALRLCPPLQPPRSCFRRGRNTCGILPPASAARAVTACARRALWPASILIKLTEVFASLLWASPHKHALTVLPFSDLTAPPPISDAFVWLFFLHRATVFLRDLEGTKWRWRSSGPVCLGP